MSDPKESLRLTETVGRRAEVRPQSGHRMRPDGPPGLPNLRDLHYHWLAPQPSNDASRHASPVGLRRMSRNKIDSTQRTWSHHGSSASGAVRNTPLGQHGSDPSKGRGNAAANTGKSRLKYSLGRLTASGGTLPEGAFPLLAAMGPVLKPESSPRYREPLAETMFFIMEDAKRKAVSLRQLSKASRVVTLSRNSEFRALTVDEVDDNSFTAIWREDGSADRRVRFPMSLVARDDKLICEPGAELYWIAGEEVDNGQPRRIDELRFRRKVGASKTVMELAQKRAREAIAAQEAYQAEYLEELQKRLAEQ